MGGAGWRVRGRGLWEDPRPGRWSLGAVSVRVEVVSRPGRRLGPVCSTSEEIAPGFISPKALKKTSGPGREYPFPLGLGRTKQVVPLNARVFFPVSVGPPPRVTFRLLHLKLIGWLPWRFPPTLALLTRYPSH